jgi:hypothetical protein
MNTTIFENFPARISSARAFWLQPVIVLSLCVVLSACISNNAATGGGGGGGGSGTSPDANLSPSSLFFQPEAVGTSSPAESITLQNKGNASLSISSIAVTGTNSGDFSEVNTCGNSLNSGAECNIAVTFSPTASGNLSASITVTDNASPSTQAASLSGTGSTSGNGSACTGAPLPQVPVDVTSQLSFVASGLTVTQLTTTSCNRFYYFDAPAYSSVDNKIIYTNYVTASGNTIMSADPDGSNAAPLATETGAQPFISPDGLLAYFDKPILGGVPNGEDIFGGFLNVNPFAESQITNLDLAAQPPLPVWEISPSASDGSGGQYIAFSPDTLLHEVHVPANGPPQIMQSITLNDPESNSTFHRLRMNPKFPNIVMYKRNGTQGAGGTPELWLVDLNTCQNYICASSSIINLVANLLGQGQPGEADHMVWSPDGLDIDFLEPDIADSWLAQNVVKSDGTINANFTLTELGPFGTPAMTADYCVFPHDWPTATVLACVAGPASPTKPKTAYLMSSDGKGTTKLLSATDALVVTINGTPMPQFGQDDEHLMFNSDRTGIPQIYLITGFTLSVP